MTRRSWFGLLLGMLGVSLTPKPLLRIYIFKYRSGNYRFLDDPIITCDKCWEAPTGAVRHNMTNYFGGVPMNDPRALPSRKW